MAGVCFYGILWAEGANDVLADQFQVPLYTITWIARVAIFVVPIGAYYVTKRICLGLQRRDAGLLTHGVEIGIIRQLPSGEFIEEERPLTKEERAVVDSKKVVPALPAPGEPDANGVPAPASRGIMGWARGIANQAFVETVAVGDGHGNGHGHPNGHEAVEGGEHAAVGAADSGESGDHEEH
jgi:ubiquinol-cytochrome c reductase cytochrome b subunit